MNDIHIQISERGAASVFTPAPPVVRAAKAAMVGVLAMAGWFVAMSAFMIGSDETVGLLSDMGEALASACLLGLVCAGGYALVCGIKGRNATRPYKKYAKTGMIAGGAIVGIVIIAVVASLIVDPAV